jgi:dihydropteroate synthase
MGILNVTPDSFSDGGRFLDPEKAIEHGRTLIAEGADLVDVGGESSRPNATPVSEAEELARVLPVIEALAGRVRLSIDTVKPRVAEAAVAAGASLINDVSGTLGPVAAVCGVGWVSMHRQGTPADMQNDPHYDDVVNEVHGAILAKARDAQAAGVSEIWVDPGIGFGKTLEHNLALLGHVDQLVAEAHKEGFGVLVGTSRKSFLGRLVEGDPNANLPADQRLEGSLATATWAMANGCGMVRVHDVAPTVHAAILVEEAA